MHGPNSGAHWFNSIILAVHKDKLSKRKARILALIDDKEDLLESCADIPNREEGAKILRAELTDLKKEAKDIDNKLAKMWRMPPADVLAKIQMLYSAWGTNYSQAYISRQRGENETRAEKPLAAARELEQSKFYQAKADKLRAEYDELQSRWKVPLDHTDAARLGLIKILPDGCYEVL